MKTTFCFILMTLGMALQSTQGLGSEVGNSAPSELQGITCDAVDYAGRNLYKTAEWTVIFDGEGPTSLAEKTLVEKTIDDNNLFRTIEVFETGRVIQAKDWNFLKFAWDELIKIDQIGGTYIECVRVPQHVMPLP
jgi:hypothetical protein